MTKPHIVNHCRNLLQGTDYIVVPKSESVLLEAVLKDAIGHIRRLTESSQPNPYIYGAKAWLAELPRRLVTESEVSAHRQANELGHESDGRLFHEAACRRCGLLLAYLVRDQVECGGLETTKLPAHVL